MKKSNKKKQNRTSHIALHTSQKGITLIALIITIIVMLILVGVTINVALNGGLFDKATEASEGMQIAAEKEELLSAVMGAIGNDGKIKFGEIKLPEGWDVVAERTYKSPKQNIYIVDENGKITEGQSGSEEVYDDLAYIRAEVLGKKFSELIDAEASATAGTYILKNRAITFKEKYQYDPIAILSYNGKDFVACWDRYDSNPEVTFVYYDVKDSNDYFDVVMSGVAKYLDEDMNFEEDSIIILGLTQNGEERLASTKKLVIPKAILGTDGKNHDVVYLDFRCFEYNIDIEKLEFESGSNIDGIGYGAFDSCTNLSGTVVIPNGVTTIGPYAFDGCNLIEEIKNPSSVIEIGHEAFRGCTSIESITIPSSVDNLGRGVFDGWTSAQTIYMQKTEEPATTDEYTGELGWYSGWREGCNANVLWGQ